MTSAVATVSAALGVAEWAVRERRPGELVLETDAVTVPALADRVTRRVAWAADVALRERRTSRDRALRLALHLVPARSADVPSRHRSG